LDPAFFPRFVSDISQSIEPRRARCGREEVVGKTAPECPNRVLQARRGKTSNREFDLTIGTLSPVLDDTNVPIAGTTIDDFPSFRARLGKWQGKTRPRGCTQHFICEITRPHLKVLHLPSMLGPKNG
jgi:hypothetical protein